MSNDSGLQKFTSWKLDVIDMVTCDDQLSRCGGRIIIRLLQHINSRTLTAEVSIDRLAAQMGVSRQTANGAMTEARKRGYVTASRTRRTSFASYRIDPPAALVNALLDEKLVREETAKDRLKERRSGILDVKNSLHQRGLDVKKSTLVDVKSCRSDDVNHVFTVTPSKEPPTINTSFEEMGMEGEGSFNDYALVSRGAA